MKKRSMPLHTFALLLLALGSAPGQPPPSAAARSCFGGLLRLHVPAGWQVREVDEGVLALVPARGPQVELKSWATPKGGEASARAAAAAHESALFERMPYRRLSAGGLQAGGGLEGLLVTGEVLGEDGREARITFGAFAWGGRYVTLGLLEPEGNSTAAERTLRDLVAAVEFVPPPPPGNGRGGEVRPLPVEPHGPPAGPAPLPAQPEPIRPGPGPVSALPTTRPSGPRPGPGPTQPEPPKPLPAPEPVGPTTAPVIATPPPRTPPPKPPEPPKPAWVRHRAPEGYSLEHPPGWGVATVGGHIEVTAPSPAVPGAPPAAAVIWPVAQVAEGQDPAALGRALLAACPLVGARATDLRSRSGQNAAFLAGEVGPPGAPRQLVACCFLQRDQGLLTAVLARPEDFAARLPELLHVLGSFTGGPWWADAPGAAPGATTWQAPGDSGLRVPVPAGWHMDGQVRQRDDLWAIELEMMSADQALRCWWRQPAQPLYRDLTPVLRNLGWQDGDRYPANVKENQLRIAARLSPQDFLTRVWLAENRSRLGQAVVERLTPDAAVAELAGRENASGVTARVTGRLAAGPREALCLVATGDVAPGGEPNCWQAAVLAAEGPPNRAAEAAAILRAVVEGATVATTALPGPADGVREMVLTARKAVQALPGAAPTRPSHVDVLTIHNDEARGRLWLLAPSALAPWRDAGGALARGESVAAAVPELGAEYWK